MLFSNHKYFRNYDPIQVRKNTQERKLYFLKLLEESLERKLAAVRASLQVMENQINKDAPE